MFRLIDLKTISTIAASLAVLIGALAASPVATAYARKAEALPRSFAMRQAGTAIYRLHLHNNLVFEGGNNQTFSSSPTAWAAGQFHTTGSLANGICTLRATRH